LAKENGLKAKDLSELTGKSCSTISNWLNGKGTPPKPCELFIITRRLNTTFEYLATGDREVRDLNQIYSTESVRQKIREVIG